MKEKLLRFGVFLLKLLLWNLEGWYLIFTNIYNRGLRAYRRIPLLDQGFLVLSVAGFLLAFLPWFSYQISLPEKEIVRVSSVWKILFLLPGVLGPILYILDFKRAWISFLIPSSAVLLIYLLGLIAPGSVHTRMMVRTDYVFLPWLYLYGPVLIAQIAIASKALKRDTFQPLNLIRSEKKVLERRNQSFTTPEISSSTKGTTGQKVSSETLS